MDYVVIAKLVWSFIKDWGKKIGWFFSTTIGKVLLAVLLFWGYGHFQHNAGVAEGKHTESVAWTRKWNAHVDQDKREAQQRKDAADRAAAANKALMKAEGDIITDLQKQLNAEKARKNKVHVITHEVTKYVTPKADAAAVVPAGFVWLHNAAASDSTPVPFGPPRDVDAPSGVALSTVAAVVDYNYDECVARGEMLNLWQTWYTRNQAAWTKADQDSGPPPK